jgi:hypothetical protein
LVSRFAKAVRPEERLLLAILLLGAGLCLASGTGFAPLPMVRGYVRFFGHYTLFLFALTRLTDLARTGWEPRGPAGRRLLAWLGGSAKPGEIAGPDLEFLRGLALLFLSLSVYTSIKIRIPMINPAIGDAFFQRLDHLLLGQELVPWLERTVAAAPWLASLLARVYFHDYIWMVVLLVLFWIRHDRARMRWLFASVCLVYLLGILVTAAYPSFGPFFFERERFAWLEGSLTAQAQSHLGGHLVENLQRFQSGRPLLSAAFLGVAAFPSLHVAHMVILVVIAWRPARLFALWVLLMTLLTTLATVAFGWHYFVDALGGAALAVAVPLGLRRIIKLDPAGHARGHRASDAGNGPAEAQ